MQEASLVRQHILKQAPQYTLLHLIVRFEENDDSWWCYGIDGGDDDEDSDDGDDGDSDGEKVMMVTVVV